MLNNESTIPKNVDDAHVSFTGRHATTDDAGPISRLQVPNQLPSDDRFNLMSHIDDAAIMEEQGTSRPVSSQPVMLGLPASAFQTEDFSWLDSLPTDLMAIDDAELFSVS